MIELKARPQTKKEAFENGTKCHSESQNPYRNMGAETTELEMSWFEGFELKNKCKCKCKNC